MIVFIKNALKVQSKINRHLSGLRPPSWQWNTVSLTEAQTQPEDLWAWLWQPLGSRESASRYAENLGQTQILCLLLPCPSPPESLTSLSHFWIPSCPFWPDFSFYKKFCKENKTQKQLLPVTCLWSNPISIIFAPHFPVEASFMAAEAMVLSGPQGLLSFLFSFLLPHPQCLALSTPALQSGSSALFLFQPIYIFSQVI